MEYKLARMYGHTVKSTYSHLHSTYNADAAFGCWHHVQVGYVADIPENILPPSSVLTEALMMEAASPLPHDACTQKQDQHLQ
jgi:hypothetical protein